MELQAITLTLTSISLTSILLVIITTSAYANIGKVVEQKGVTNIERGEDGSICLDCQVADVEPRLHHYEAS